MKRALISLAFTLILAAGGFAQEREPETAPPADILAYSIDAELVPENHELKASARVTFKALRPAERLSFMLNRNLEVEQVLDEKGGALDYEQDLAAGTVNVLFGRRAAPGEVVTIKLSYGGTFERGAFQRERNEEIAYIGDEGSYLLHAARWLPLLSIGGDRATFEIRATAPLGVTVVGPGQPGPVKTQGIKETFTWISNGEISGASIVAARYFEKTHDLGQRRLVFYLQERHLEHIQRYAEAFEKILAFYEKEFGAYNLGNEIKLVEVADAVVDKSGSAGLVFVNSKDLEPGRPLDQPLARALGYQWWLHMIGPKSESDLWLSDALAYYSAALYAERQGEEAFQNALTDLAILALKFEGRNSISRALETGYGSETYEGVAAGKGAWTLHMLRKVLGNDKFAALIKRLPHGSAPDSAALSRSELEEQAGAAYGGNISWFFVQWVDSIGVPDFKAEYMILRTKDGYKVRGTIKQDLDLFRMPVEIEIETKGGKKEYKVIEVQGKNSNFEVEAQALPIKVQVDPRNSVLRNSDSLKVSVHIAKGRRLFERGEFVEAIREFNEAIRLDPRSSLAHFYLAETFYEQWNNQAAANSFRDALNGDLKPKWVEVWSYIYLGKIFDILGQRERARAEYNKAINTKDDTFGAQAEAQKYLNQPFARQRPSKS